MFGPKAKSFEIDLSSGSTLTSALALGGHSWDNVFLEIPTHASGGTHYIHVSDDESGNFHRLHLIDEGDGGDNVIQILAPNGKVVKLPNGLSFVKVENTSGVTDSTMSYVFYCS